MQYKCIVNIKGGLIFGNGHRVGDIISKEVYDKLPSQRQMCFKEDHSDEPLGDQITENIESDNDT